MYDLKTRLLVDNPSTVTRSAIARGLEHGPDGGLTIYVQKNRRARRRKAMAPAPNGPMSIISRMYGPDSRILNRSYKFPYPVRQGA